MIFCKQNPHFSNDMAKIVILRLMITLNYLIFPKYALFLSAANWQFCSTVHHPQPMHFTILLHKFHKFVKIFQNSKIFLKFVKIHQKKISDIQQISTNFTKFLENFDIYVVKC